MIIRVGPLGLDRVGVLGTEALGVSPPAPMPLAPPSTPAARAGVKLCATAPRSNALPAPRGDMRA